MCSTPGSVLVLFMFLDVDGWKVCGKHLVITEECDTGDPEEKQLGPQFWRAV